MRAMRAMRPRLCMLSAALALAAPSAALAMPSPASVSDLSLRAIPHQAAPADARVAIILQRKPPDRKPPPPKQGH
jgi:hypothetical protein